MSEGQSSVENYLDKKELAEYERVARESSNPGYSPMRSRGTFIGKENFPHDDEIIEHNPNEFIGKGRLGRVYKEEEDKLINAIDLPKLDLPKLAKDFQDGAYHPETDEEREQIEAYLDHGSYVYDDPAEYAVEDNDSSEKYEPQEYSKVEKSLNPAPHEATQETKHDEDEYLSKREKEVRDAEWLASEKARYEQQELDEDYSDENISESEKTGRTIPIGRQEGKLKSIIGDGFTRKYRGLQEQGYKHRNKQGQRESLTMGGSRSEPLRGDVRGLEQVGRQLEAHEKTQSGIDEESRLARERQREQEYLDWWKSTSEPQISVESEREAHGAFAKKKFSPQMRGAETRKKHREVANWDQENKDREAGAWVEGMNKERETRIVDAIRTAEEHFGNKLISGLMEGGTDRNMDRKDNPHFCVPKKFVRTALATTPEEFGKYLGLQGYNKAEIVQIQEAVLNGKYRPLVETITSLSKNGSHGVVLGGGEAQMFYVPGTGDFVVRPTRRGKLRGVRDAMANGGLESLFPESK